MTIEEKIKEKLNVLENNIKIYAEFTQDKSNPEDDRKIAGFKLFYDIVAFSSLLELDEEYVPKKESAFMIALSLKGVDKFVNIVNDKVVISDEYRELLKMKNNA